MSRTKIDYGIDLGTTNSAISRMEHGVPVIKKSDTLKDTMPSCISINKKQTILVGDKAYSQLQIDKRLARKDPNYTSNTFIEFKRTMGTDKQYQSSHMDRSYSSEELSAEVLKTLRSFITDEEVKAVVITVPAKFTMNQKDATARAAKLAGFRHCELLQEPIAASMTYGLGASQRDGYWLVFDFGGGTFDAALLKVEEGIMKVIDTEGDNYLGGKNLDFAIIDEIILPYFEKNYKIDSIMADPARKEIFRNAWKAKAEEAKIQLSFRDEYNVLTDLGEDYGTDDDDEAFELDITLTQNDMVDVMGPIFQKSIDICLELLKRNNLPPEKLGSVILVGGPTYSPILRNMLKAQLTEHIDTSVDPMTAVAKGAALFASTLDIPESIIEESRDRSRVQLSIGYEPTTVEMEEFVTIKTLPEKMGGEIPGNLFVEVHRGDKGWSSGKIELNETGKIIDVKLNAGKSNTFSVHVTNEQGDTVQAEPGEFTIIQGSVIGKATLPYHIGIEILQRFSGKMVFQPIRGLEKNKQMPAVGIINGLKTQKQIRPGVDSDFIKISLYEGEHNAEGSRAIYNEHVSDIVISGEDLPSLLPEGSAVDLTVTMESERMKLEAYFPYLDYSAVIIPESVNRSALSPDWLRNELRKARDVVRSFRSEGHVNEQVTEPLENELNALERSLDQGEGDEDRKNEVLTHLRKILRKIDDLTDATEWPKVEKELDESLMMLERANLEYGDDRSSKHLERLRKQVEQCKKDKNIKVANALMEEIHHLHFVLTKVQTLTQYVYYYNQEFNNLRWSDSRRARNLIDEGLSIIQKGPEERALLRIVISLGEMLPPEQKAGQDDSVLTN